MEIGDIKNISNWIEERVKLAGAKGVVLGLSGGIDSAVLAGICRLAFPVDTCGIIMPCHSDEEDEAHGRIVANAFDLKLEKVDLTSTYDELIENSFNSENRMAKSNIKPRLRMTTLYYYAQSMNYLVCSGSNKSEFYLGYFTKHGDSGADLLPLVDFTKREIYEMAELLKVPQEIILKPPSAGLWTGQSDEDEMGFTYDELEAHFNGESIDSNIENKIKHMHSISGHKREFPQMYFR